MGRAIHLGGRKGGVAGLEAVAHIIQNRCHHGDFPDDAQAVVLAGDDQFSFMQHSLVEGARAPQQTEAESPGDCELLALSLKFAQELVQHPRLLAGTDPTDGALYFSLQSPAAASSAGGAPSGSSSLSSSTSTVSSLPGSVGDSQFGGGLGSIQPASLGIPSATGYSLSGDDSRMEDLLRPAMPPRTRRPGALLRDRSMPTFGGSTFRHAIDFVGAVSRADLTASTSEGRFAHQFVGGSSSTAASSTVSFRALPPLSARGPRRSFGLPASSCEDRFGPLGASLSGGRLRSCRRLLRRSLADEDDEEEEEERRRIMLPCGLFQHEVMDILHRDLTPEDFDMLNKLDERLPKRNIAQRSFVESLPQVAASAAGGAECGVCLQAIDPTVSARIVQLPCCRHAFHLHCISKWLTQCKNTCPFCSTLIDQTQASRPSSNCSDWNSDWSSGRSSEAPSSCSL